MMGGRARQIDLDLYFEGEREPAEEKGTPSPEMAKLLAKAKAKVDRKKSRSKTIGGAQFDRAKADVLEAIENDDWAKAASHRHLVAIYDLMHQECYGVAPAELGPTERYNAAMMAHGFVKREFSGDYRKAVDYMNWAWEREIGREKWRRENAREGGRLGVRAFFSGYLLSDYRVYLARSRRAP